MMLFPDILAQRARAQPDRLAYRFYRGSGEPQTLSYAQVWQCAVSLAGELACRGWRGERALVVCASERNFVVAFYACLLAGVVAVPAAPPRRQLLRGRLELLAADSRAAAILSDMDGLQSAGVAGPAGVLPVLDVRVQQACAAPADAVPADITPEDIAFLQYTSGSTGDPKGVVVTHGNLIDNSDHIRRAMAIDASSSVLVGLPLFHDMGLVGGVLQSMFVGCSTSFIPPAELVQFPERWLRLISSLRITTSGGPNYMYELAADTVAGEEVSDLDLSCWKVAFCGAEPVRAGTIERFTRRFGPAGFDPGAFFPCYGMAEATLLVSGGPPGRPPDVVRRDGADVVCCGAPAAGLQVRIVDPETCLPAPATQIGEVWVRGNSVAQGYWMRPELTRERFGARIDGEEGAHYLRTGDLGWLEGGRLFIAGRLTDLIIVNGRKYAPQDVEEVVERCCEGIRRGGVAAFSVDDGRACAAVVVVAELERTWLRNPSSWPQIESMARAAVSAAHGLAIAQVVFAAPGGLPRTSSGKVRRSQCRADYLGGQFARTDAASRDAAVA